VVSSLNPEASAVFNSPKGYPISSTRPEEAGGYLVRSDGNIQFPILGAVQAEGLTTQALKEEIVKDLRDRKLLVDPIVSVRYLNFRITVLGEVGKPSVINVPNERINVLEALGLAGDITVFGKRDNVMLIREENGNKTIRRLNLNSPEFLTSPYYYLRSNDIIYVQPNNGKIASSNRTLLVLPIVLSALSFTAIIVTNIND
jgi:polysaccharide export outer membrane protein